MSKTLLAIDDSLTMRKVYEITFAGDEYSVVTAETGKAGVEKASSSSPSVVLVDGSLGSEDSYAVAKEIRAKHPQAAIFLMSSKQQAYDAAKGKDAGVDDFAEKPFDSQQFLDKVKKAVLAKDGAPAPSSKSVAAATPASSATPAAKSASPARSKTLVFGPEMLPTKDAPKPAAAPAAVSPAPSPKAPAVSAMGSADVMSKLSGMGLSKEQIEGVLSLSKEIVERAVWEVVPQLAETMIREEIDRLTK